VLQASCSALFYYAQNCAAFGSYACSNPAPAISFRHQPRDPSYFYPRPLNAIFDNISLVGFIPDPFRRRSVHQFLCRPVEGDRRVAPDALRTYRETHKFLGPCCFCPLLGLQGGVENQFVEASIHVSVSGRYTGEYVAECAKSRCGYLGLPRYFKLSG
jgi:hypothetical protein